jgi:RNA polymerase sigma-70 factor (ECF subfamily)
VCLANLEKSDFFKKPFGLALFVDRIFCRMLTLCAVSSCRLDVSSLCGLIMVSELDKAKQSLDRYRAYLQLLARLHLNRELRGQVEPSDIVQEALIKAHQKMDQFRGQNEGELTAWLRRILANTLIDALRKHQRRAAVLRNLEADLDQSSARLEAWLAAEQSSPSEQTIRQEQLFRLAEALADLPEDQRTAVELHYLRDAPLAEIAATMQRTEPSVAGLLRRGLEKLRGLLQEHR